LISSVQQQPWELSAIIYDVCFFIILGALAVGQLTMLFRGLGRCVDYLSKRFFLGQKLADMVVEDWNKVHIARYTPDQVEYLKGGTEEYRLHVEDYRELLRLLTFVDEQSFT
uniref:ABC transmembrane type-1 domain-containing protein n=1 Tax=Echinostoma caproni TaxID=27848 RepID=A0A183BCK0_9TREM